MKATPRLCILVTFLASSFLGACGGGGGGGISVPTEPVGITDTNASQVAAGVPMTASLIDFQDFMSFDTLTAQGEGTFGCPDGGSITAAFQVDAAPVGQLSSGDRFTVSFNNCKLDSASTVNGGIAIDFNTITGDWQVDDVWEVDTGFQINHLTFSSGPAHGTFDGSWSQDTTYDTGNATFSLTGDFTTSVSDGSELTAAALDGLVLSWSYDATAAEATYSVDGQFASTELGGSVVLTTLAAFVKRDADNYPHSGSVRATGAAGSTLTFTAQDENFVQLDVDADGDGLAEFTVNVAWTDLGN
jgi:hypothetical protein